MSNVQDIEAAKLLEFVGGPGIAVVLVSVHPRHTFNAALARRLAAAQADVRLATVSVIDLFVTGGTPVIFLIASLNMRGVKASLGVLPGYYLFANGQLLAWDAGLPGRESGETIAGSLLLGTLWSGVTRDLSFIAQALRQAATESGAARVARRFEEVLAQHQGQRAGAHRDASRAAEDLKWACRVLGVAENASDREIHHAWKRRRVEYHPDRARDHADFERRSRISTDINRARDILLALRHAGAGAH